MSVLVIGALCWFGCHKTEGKVKAVVHDTGQVAADGCGWMIELEGETAWYHPVELASKYQKDNLKVWIELEHKTDTFTCGLAATPYAVIEIEDIFKR